MCIFLSVGPPQAALRYGTSGSPDATKLVESDPMLECISDPPC